MQIKLKVLLCAVVLACCYPVLEVCRGEADTSELPIITTWSDGVGYTEDGELIRGTWAYDAINPVGKYVLFGEDGMPLKKTDHWEDRDNLTENYTDTDNEPAVVALRAEIFPDFAGVVRAVLEEKGGAEWYGELTAENQYGYNISVSSGEYILKEAAAYDGEFIYHTVFSPDSFWIQDTELTVVNIQVSDEKVGAAEAAKQAEIKNEADADENTGETITAGDVTATEADAGINDNMKLAIEDEAAKEIQVEKLWLLCGFAIIVCVTGYFILRDRKNTYQ